MGRNHHQAPLHTPVLVTFIALGVIFLLSINWVIHYAYYLRWVGLSLITLFLVSFMFLFAERIAF